MDAPLKNNQIINATTPRHKNVPLKDVHNITKNGVKSVDKM
jgi:hypothetical protein